MGLIVARSSYECNANEPHLCEVFSNEELPRVYASGVESVLKTSREQSAENRYWIGSAPPTDENSGRTGDRCHHLRITLNDSQAHVVRQRISIREVLDLGQ